VDTAGSPPNGTENTATHNTMLTADPADASTSRVIDGPKLKITAKPMLNKPQIRPAVTARVAAVRTSAVARLLLLHQLIEILLDRVEQRLQTLRPKRRLLRGGGARRLRRGHGLNGYLGDGGLPGDHGLFGDYRLFGENGPFWKHRSDGFGLDRLGSDSLVGRCVGVDELAVQYVLATAHQKEDHPIGYRQQNDAKNTDFKHRSRPMRAVSRESRFSVKTAESDCLSVRYFGIIMLNAVPRMGPAEE
jgi:hypothetical protein